MGPLTKKQFKNMRKRGYVTFVLNHLMEKIQRLETIAIILVAIEGLLI